MIFMRKKRQFQQYLSNDVYKQEKPNKKNFHRIAQRVGKLSQDFYLFKFKNKNLGIEQHTVTK